MVQAGSGRDRSETYTFASKTPSYKRDQDSRAELVDVSLSESDQQSFLLDHFSSFTLLCFFLSQETVWNKGIIFVFTPHVPSAPLDLILKGCTFFSSVTRSTPLDLRLFVYSVLFSPKRSLLLRKSPGVFSFPS